MLFKLRKTVLAAAVLVLTAQPSLTTSIPRGPPGGGGPGGGPGGPGGNNSPVQRACTQMQTLLGPSIVQFSSGPSFMNAATQARNLFNTVQRPTCIVFPQSTLHVSAAMGTIFRNNVDYAVQAGGHSAMVSWNNVQGGVLIIFSNMNNVQFNPSTNTITVQPGVRWGEAIAQLAPHGVAPMGGRLGDIGTGLLLGGGLSYLGGENGYSADAFKELDVVLVNGTTVTATATNQHADLFRALKGGANRFGIVTRYELEAISTGTANDKNFFGGMVMYSSDTVPAVLEAVQKFGKNVNDPKAALLTVIGNIINGTAPTVTVHFTVMIYHGTELPQSIYGDFLAIPSVSSQIGPLSYQEATSLLGLGGADGSGHLYGGAALGQNAPLSDYTKTLQVFNQYTEDIRDQVVLVILAFTPILRSQVQAGRDKGGNIMDPPLQNFFAVQVDTQFLPGIQTVSPAITARRKRLFRDLPSTPGFPIYVGESDANQKVFATYGRFEEMKRTYRKYDPTRFNVRHTAGPIGL